MVAQPAVQTAAVDSHSAQDGARIPALTRREAGGMSAEELERFIALIETLSGDDWQQPTACTLWTVRDVIAHQGAHVLGFTGLGRFLGQLNPARLRPYRQRGMNALDAWNQSQVDLRRDLAPEALVAEIRDAAQASLAGRDRIPGVLRAITLPLPGFDQPRSFGYLFDVIYTRDMWMHRLDISRATGRQMPLDAVYDGRTVALIVRDLALKAQRDLKGRSALLDLAGAAGGRYRIGGAGQPEAVISMDVLDFCVLTSGRSTAADALASGQVRLSGDTEFGRSVVAYCENRVLF